MAFADKETEAQKHAAGLSYGRSPEMRVPRVSVENPRLDHHTSGVDFWGVLNAGTEKCR